METTLTLMLGALCVSSSYQNRLEIILERWIESRQVPSPAEVSKEEGVDLLGSRGEKQKENPLHDVEGLVKLNGSYVVCS